jgi:hypothetical protein
VFQQDGAPAHTSKWTQDWLAANLSSYWDKTVWPPSSPDLNPLDYSIWGFLEAKACQTSHTSIEDLKKLIMSAWRGLSKDYIVKTCRQFRMRLEKVAGCFKKSNLHRVRNNFYFMIHAKIRTPLTSGAVLLRADVFLI